MARVRVLSLAVLIFAPTLVPTRAVSAQMDRPAGVHAHMSFTSLRPGTATDTARALAVVAALRTAIEPYQTLDDARAAGYRWLRDPATVRPGQLLHAGKRVRPLAGAQPFDPREPQSLLYHRDTDGSMRLAGAMYVAPRSATTDDLDAMIPLSVAHWHRHVDICVPADRSLRRIRLATTPEACAAAGGRFREETRYMVHVMTDAGDDLARTFPQGREQMEGMDMGSAHEH
jgi:hypothetical protein